MVHSTVGSAPTNTKCRAKLIKFKTYILLSSTFYSNLLIVMIASVAKHRGPLEKELGLGLLERITMTRGVRMTFGANA